MKIAQKNRTIRQRLNDPAFVQMLQQHPLVLAKAALTKGLTNDSPVEKKH